jgi:hypothetical protein
MRLQPGQQLRAKPIVVSLAGRGAKLHRQTVGIHNSVNLASELTSQVPPRRGLFGSIGLMAV